MTSKTAAAGYRLIRREAPDETAREAVRAGLKRFNDGFTVPAAAARHLDNKGRPLDVLLEGPDGAPAGGLLGYTQWGWLHIQTLWVAGALRGQGYGRALVAAAEAEALRRGCHSSRLGTYTFQAPAFYEKLGYRVYGAVPDYPPGYTNYHMRKDLRAAPDSGAGEETSDGERA